MNENEKAVRVEMHKPENTKDLGGGSLDAWNDRLMLRVLNALPIDRSDKAEVGKVGTAVFSGMIDIKSGDPIEGMLISQLVVAHEWAMMMFQKAWSQPSEYFDARCRYLALADKAQRTVVLLTERLDRHRNSGQQQITVRHQHVTVNADQAIVGNVEHHQGGGAMLKSKDQPHAIAHALEPALWSQDQEQQPCRSAAMKNGRCRMHGGTSPGAPKGNRNALKHGWYTAEAIAMRRLLASFRR